MRHTRETRSRPAFRVIDLFAGPGGLAEGFSSVLSDSGERAFDIVLSAEKDPAAHRTLSLRAFTRQFPPEQIPDSYYAFCEQRITIEELAGRHPSEWAAACDEAMLVELGTPAGNQRIDERLRILLRNGGKDPGRDFIVIGGPPCQAYSLVGRARNAGISGYEAEKDHRHFLYREYIRILSRVGPAAFVMENVKGMLSAAVGGSAIFEKVLEDLRQPDGGRYRYRLLALSPARDLDTSLAMNPRPQDFIVRAEQHGIPQARHRVIILGVREDLIGSTGYGDSLDRIMPPASEVRTVEDVIGQLPKLRSGLSRGDSSEDWHSAYCSALAAIVRVMSEPGVTEVDRGIRDRARELCRTAEQPTDLPRTSDRYRIRKSNDELLSFLQDPRLKVLPNHESRGHMESDLARYLFCSLFAEQTGRSPKAGEFPAALAPAHANWTSGKFTDRFRAQVWGAPSTTITSHISKDGHYFIHPNPAQCRSLTVREAARLQTFPDNYTFLGNRTEQFVQVGNAVPRRCQLNAVELIYWGFGHRAGDQKSLKIRASRGW